MIQSNISMPHPVLGIGTDFLEGSFNATVKIKIDRLTRSYIFYDIAVEITNSYIKELYDNNKINFIIKVSCSPTYKTWTYTNPSQISIPENEIDQLIEIDSFLLASEQIENYYDTTFNPDFENKRFGIEKNDILGLTGSKRIPIRKDNEKVSLGSIFRFSKIPIEAETQELHFDLDGDQIAIYYPSSNSNYDPVTLLFDKVQGLPYTALNLYILPALTEAFTSMLDPKDNTYRDKKWYSILDALLPSNEREEDPFVNAQKSIRVELPINMAFNEIIKIKNMNV